MIHYDVGVSQGLKAVRFIVAEVLRVSGAKDHDDCLHALHRHQKHCVACVPPHKSFQLFKVIIDTMTYRLPYNEGRLLRDGGHEEHLQRHQHEGHDHQYLVVQAWSEHHPAREVFLLFPIITHHFYLYSKSVEERESPSDRGGDDEGDDMEEADQLLQAVDGVLDYLLYHHGEPESVELGHVVAKCANEAHCLASQGPPRLDLKFV